MGDAVGASIMTRGDQFPPPAKVADDCGHRWTSAESRSSRPNSYGR